MAEPIPLARPDLGEAEEQAVLEVMRSGRLSLGPVLEAFEEAFAAQLGVDHAVAVSSGTAALHLAVRQAGWGPGDEVLTSPFSFVASANCILYEGATPVFCDIDPASLNIDPAAAGAAICERTAGILPVHIFGRSADMPALEDLASTSRLSIVEDACEAFGAADIEGKAVGARGNLATFAFYANKQITTGEGGMLVCPDAASAELARSERNQGRATDMGWLTHERLGFNYRLSEIAAAIGLVQVRRADEILARRSEVASWYAERLATVEGLTLPADAGGASRRGWFVYVLTLPPGADRDEIIERLGEKGIASKAYLPCIHLIPFYRERFGFSGGEFPVAEDVASRSLALPFFNAMEEGQVERVCAELTGLLG